MIKSRWIIILTGLVLSVAGCASRPASTAIAPEPAPAEIRRGVEMATTDPAARLHLGMDRLARSLEPDLHGQAARLPRYIELFKHASISDRRLFAFDVKAE